MCIKIARQYLTLFFCKTDSMNTEKLYAHYLKNPSVQTDSRKVQPGDIFFAIKGPNYNANSFAKDAVDAGASLAVIDDVNYEGEKTLLVEDALKQLQDLALHHRKTFKIPFIAITGSNGKTTTRELVTAVLSGSYKTYSTERNLNNHIGIPLTILNIKKDAEIAVIEMGANHLGEIKSYCDYTLPTHGLISNCGKAHLEGFGSLEGVRKGKGELFDFLRENKGIAFVMEEYEYLLEMSKGISKIIYYGGKSDVTGSIIRNEPFLQAKIKTGTKEFTVNSNLVGGYNLPNILAAVCVGKYFGVSADIIKSTLEAYQPTNSRSQLLKIKNNNQVILDAYNANPSSMKTAIENFAGMEAENKILLIGAMAELGPESIQEHEKIVELIGEYKWKEVVLVGGDFLKINHPYRQFENSDQAADWLKAQNFENYFMLIKGSRSIAMEKVIQ